MPNPQALYSIDSSSLIHGWVRAYPISVFPTLWERIDDLLRQGVLCASREVLRELERIEDELFDWCKEREECFTEIDDAQQHLVARLMGNYPRLVDTTKGRSGGDPFVIALAQAHSPALTVISEETAKPSSPRIPDVCRGENIRCIRLLDFLIEQKWQFR